MTRPFRGISQARGPAKSYDVIVIGAGIGGLVCANLLAQAGMSVLLVEQHYRVGGFCSGFSRRSGFERNGRRQDFIFDAASHFYPLLGNPGSISGKLLRDLGVETNWIKLDPVDQFHLPDGSTFAVPADLNAYLAELKRNFPSERHSIDRFFRLIRKLYLLGLLHYFHGHDTKRLDPYVHLTVRDGLNRYFTSDKLKLLLTADCAHWGSPPSRTSLLIDATLRLGYFFESNGNHYPVGGSQAFADELAKRFERFGGAILTKSLVRQIIVKDKRACGVRIETGPRRSRYVTMVEAGTVVSNGDMRHTVFGLVGEDFFPQDYIAHIRRLRPSFPCYLAHIGVRGIETEVLRRVHGYYWSDWDSDRLGTGAFEFKIFVPTLYEPRMAPPGGHVLIVQKVTDVDYDAVTDWKQHKQSIERFVLGRLNELIPGFNDKIVVCQSASAHTSHRFTMNYQGAMLGWEMSPDQLGANRPDIESPISGLLYAGQWTQPGGGITPVIMSATRVARRIAGSGGNLHRTSDFTTCAPFTTDDQSARGRVSLSYGSS